MRLDAAGVDLALSALSEQLGRNTNEPIELVICGGSALQALGLVERTTRDVDVLALRMPTRRAFLPAEPLPDARCFRCVPAAGSQLP